MTAVIQHERPGDPYSVESLWLYSSASTEFVATAAWREHSRRDGPFDGPSNHKQITKLLSAESASLEALREWASAQVAAGAEWCNIHRTWLDIGGLRDNAFLESLKSSEG